MSRQKPLYWKNKLNVKIGEIPVDQMSDPAILEWMQKVKGGYAIRGNTARIWIAILRSLDQQGPPMTVRGLFYNCENVYQAVEKTLNGYRHVAQQVLAMRRAGIIPYDFVSDSTRWVRKPKTYSGGLRSFLEEGTRGYRGALWATQKDYVEVWCEKDAIAGILSDVTSTWDVPLLVVRGFSSETFLYNAAETIRAQGKPAHLFYFGDYDKNGLRISADIQRKLKSFGAVVDFQRVTVNDWQIDEWHLPTRPAKDGVWGDCVEVDAVPANKLRELVTDCIKRHIDEHAYQEELRIENLERQTLESIMWNVN